MSDRDEVEAILRARYSGSHPRDKRLDDMLAGLVARYPREAESVRYWMRQMLHDRPAWWLREPLFHVYACGHVEQRFVPSETMKAYLRYQAERAWNQFRLERGRDNAILRANFELCVAIFRDDKSTAWEKAAFKLDVDGDAA